MVHAVLPPGHPPAAELQTVRERGEFRLMIEVRDGYRDYEIDYHPFDVMGAGRLPLPVDAQHQHDFRADHRADPHAAAVTSDVRGELRHLLILSAQSSTSTRWRSRSRTTTRISRARR